MTFPLNRQIKRCWILCVFGLMFSLLSTARGRLSGHVIQNRAILQEHIFMNLTNVASYCECRNHCWVRPECTAATAYDNGSGEFDCQLSNNQSLGYFDMEPNATALTIKKGVAPRCTDPFIRTKVGCFMVSNEIADFHRCRAICQRLGGDLAVLEEGNQLEALSIIVNLSNEKLLPFYWVGIENKKWLSGQSLPDINVEYKCGVITSDRTITGKPCMEPFSCVCQRFVYE